MVKTMMIPAAVDVSGDSELAKLYAYCNSVMEPWDGPAAIAAYANNWVIAGLDRNGPAADALCGSPMTVW
jgi:glutamate synthase (NADPH/NADH) large chain